MNINQLVDLFSKNYSNTPSKESVEIFEMGFDLSELSVPTEAEIKSHVEKLPSSDVLALDIKIGSLETVSLGSAILNIPGFILDLKSKLDAKVNGEKITLKVVISKKIQNDTLSIYSFENFLRYLKSLSPIELINLLNSWGRSNSFSFHLINDSYNNKTSKFVFFSSKREDALIVNEEIRRKKTEGAISCCHHTNGSGLLLLPEDFKLVNPDQSDLKVLFDKLCSVYCLFYISDISEIKPEGFYFKINGYKSIISELTFNNLPLISLDDYYDIYLWAYQDGNLSDKLGLARNLLSLHLEDKSKLLLQEGVNESIKSAYKIYLEGNIKQYIDIRNKISDQLLEFNKRAITIVDAFAGNFQKSIFAFLTFLISLVIMRLANKQGELSISGSAAILCIALYIAVIIFIIYSRWELSEQKTRLEKSYLNMKKRFKDLLDEKDIFRIMKDDDEHKEDLKFIDSKKKKYTQMWIAVMALFAVALYLLYFKDLFDKMAAILTFFYHK